MEDSRPGRSRFAGMLKFLRELNGAMTQEELAQESSVAVGLIQNYEQGKSLAKEESQERLAEALGACPAAFQAIGLRDLISNESNDEVRLVAQLLFQIAACYDLVPIHDENNPHVDFGLAGNGGYIEYALEEWTNLVAADEQATLLAAECDGLKLETAVKGKTAERAYEKMRKFELGYDAPYEASDYPACPPRLGETLKRLRKASSLTQDDLAAAAGVSVFTIRGYEQGKRTPNDEQRVFIAKTLGVAPEVLTDFGITNPNEAFHFLMEFAHIYYMAPQTSNLGPVIAEDRKLLKAGLPKRPELAKLLGDWHFAWIDFQKTGDTEAYQDWQDHYEG